MCHLDYIHLHKYTPREKTTSAIKIPPRAIATPLKKDTLTTPLLNCDTKEGPPLQNKISQKKSGYTPLKK